jgi:hypothetical protein
VDHIPYRRSLSWLGLASICVSLAFAVARMRPSNFFGHMEDDSIYFSSAKALAEGKGYVLESFPGTPAATKYPVLYPWVLSWVWRWNPSFPANLTDAIAVTVGFGLAYVVLVFLFLRRVEGISDVEALVLAAFCGLHPLVVFYSGRLLTEIPFAALALAAIVLAENARRWEAGTAGIACCGILSGLGMLTRILGVPVAVGIGVSLARRRAWRQLAVFCGSVAPFFAVLARRILFPPAVLSPASGAGASTPGWVQTWTFYTDYLNVWKQGVPNAFVFAAMLKNNALWLVRTPADYFVWPWPGVPNLGGSVIAAVTTAFVLLGVIRLARGPGLRAFCWVLPFYALMTLLWNFPEGHRFFLPFLPLFAAGLWVEGKHVLKMVRASWTGDRGMGERVLAVVFATVAVAFVSAVSVNYVDGLRRAVDKQSRDRASFLAEKREAYDWLARFTAADARVVAYEDGASYLYSGRAAVRPLAFTTAEFYEPWRLGKILEHLTDVARAIDAQYWVVSDDDYKSEWPEAAARGSARTRELERVLPVVYRSERGRVRIYALDCIQHPESRSCEPARAVLFPDAGEKAAMLLAPREETETRP